MGEAVGMVKTCRRCGQTKPISSFPKAKVRARKSTRRVDPRKRTTLDGRDCTCRECKKRKTRRNHGARPALVVAEVAALRRIRARVSHGGGIRRRMLSDLFSSVSAFAEARAHAMHGVSLGAILYRHRYNTDPAFREAERNRQRIYKHANPDAVARWGDRRRERAARQSDGTLTAAVVARLYREPDLCPYCGVEMLPREKALDHKIPIARGGAHSISNVVVCCMDCNTEKRDMPYDRWLARVAARAGIRAA